MPPLTPEGGTAPDLHRRDALRLFAAGITAGLAACGKPDEEIVPYVRMPERLVPGEPLRYATALPLSGYGRGVLVTSVDGRPIKVEGNPRHPASFGATDVFAEADILSLYDPARSRTVLHEGEISSREAYRRAIGPELARLAANGGSGLRILTGRVGSPTLARQLDALLSRYPAARWHAHEAIGDEQAREGARLAFGRPLVALPRLEDAGVVVALDADLFGPGPDAIRLSRGFGAARRIDASRPGAVRLYAVESAPSQTGAKADHRLALSPAHVAEATLALANALGAGLRPAELPAAATRVVEVAAGDLEAAAARGLVVAGPSLPASAQALVHWINARLSAPVDLIEPVDRVGTRDPAGLADLARDLDAGRVDLLVVLGANPVYDAPGELDVASLIGKARVRVHAGSHLDETSLRATWHLPTSHPLESWSDLVAPDGTASIVQPLIRPLYATSTLHEAVAELSGAPNRSAYDLVRETWEPRAGPGFEAWWRRALHDGIVPGTRSTSLGHLPASLPEIGLPPASATISGSGLDIVLRPDPCLWDGRDANNAWLQELPKPLTKQVWGNALALGPADAGRLGIGEGALVRIVAGTRSVEAQVIVEPGHPPGCGSLTLGLGRAAAGPVGSGIGADAYRLRGVADPWTVAGAAVTATGRRAPVLTTANVVRERGTVAESLPLVAMAALAAGTLPSLDTGPLPTLLPESVRDVDGSAHAWGMVIDTALCVGCNACLVACQAENNVPVVGPEEIARGRMMSWLRLDVYDHGTAEAPKLGFQPVPCMHCEHAPCEPVCPVGASVHDSEGLNVQVYNRCVGTRFCEANCPYKVRRFNFYGYADGQEYADLGLDPYRAQKNPDVTVRARGVMEKCTYCVQRISRQRRAAARDGHPMATDVVVTACQSACPTQAITFGDLKDPSAAVSSRKADPRHYALLGHLGTRPRTTYLADLVNASPDLQGGRT